MNTKTYFCVGGTRVYDVFGLPRKFYQRRKGDFVNWVNSKGEYFFYRNDKLCKSGREKQRENFTSKIAYEKYLNNKSIKFDV